LTKNEETWSHVIFIHILASCHRKNSENDLNWTCRNRCITSKSVRLCLQISIKSKKR